MQVQNYTTVKFDFHSLQIPNDRVDLLESASKLIEFAKKAVKKHKKSENDGVMEFAGIAKSASNEIAFENKKSRIKKRKEGAKRIFGSLNEITATDEEIKNVKALIGAK